MSSKQVINLRKLDELYSPKINPLLDRVEIKTKRKAVKSGLIKNMINTDTGEIEQHSIVEIFEEKDQEHFVRIFADGVSKAYELSRTAHRVFQAVLSVYEKTPLQNGFADSVYLAWFDDGLSGYKLDMSEKTFQRGLKILIEKRFLYPKAPNLFWVNPSLFFKGNRVTFIKTYQLKVKNDYDKLEDNGQMRLVD